MLLKALRKQVASYARQMLELGLTHGTGGNISCCDRSAGLIAITPSDVPYESMRAKDIVLIDFSGVKRSGTYAPSSEWRMHAALYDRRPQLQAVVHTHSTFATVLACMNTPLPPVHYLIGVAGADVPCIPYELFGSLELATAAAKGMDGRNAVLLGNHGLLCAGKTLDAAFHTASEIEFVSKIYYHTLSHTPSILSAQQFDEALLRFENYRPR